MMKSFAFLANVNLVTFLLLSISLKISWAHPLDSLSSWGDDDDGSLNSVYSPKAKTHPTNDIQISYPKSYPALPADPAQLNHHQEQSISIEHDERLISSYQSAPPPLPPFTPELEGEGQGSRSELPPMSLIDQLSSSSLLW